MFYSQVLLSRKGTLGRAWLAAHYDKKLTKAQVRAAAGARDAVVTRTMATFDLVELACVLSHLRRPADYRDSHLCACPLRLQARGSAQVRARVGSTASHEYSCSPITLTPFVATDLTVCA